MTPHQADLFDVVEGQNLGVEVANGHVIRCSVTGKIQLHMLDDNGVPLAAVLHDVMYVPGLSHRLFSITRFAKHGHFTTIRNGSTTLYFGPAQSLVTLINEGCHPMAADVTATSLNTVPHAVPSHRSHDHSAEKRRTALDFGALTSALRASEMPRAPCYLRAWCLGRYDCPYGTGARLCELRDIHHTCNQQKQRSTHRWYIRVRIRISGQTPPVVTGGLKAGTTFAFYLIIVDAYSRYCCIYAIPEKSSSAVIDA
jgi:hypothetical protein